MCWAPVRGWDSGQGKTVLASMELGLMGRGQQAGHTPGSRLQVIAAGAVREGRAGDAGKG